MVLDTTSGLQPDDGVDGFDAGGEATDELLDAEPVLEPSTEVDPLAELRTQIGAAARRDELDSLRNQVRSELGRSQRLEARLDALTGANPLADVDPRLDANETLLISIASALADSELSDDRMKGTLRSALAALDQAKGARATRRLREELKDDILKAVQPAAEPASSEDPWTQATADVIAELRERLPDFDIASIPIAVWDEGKSKGTPTRAAAHVLRWAESHAQEPVIDRAAARRAAAGEGAPARGAGGPTIIDASDNDDAWNDGLISDDVYKKNRIRLGVGVAPGGGR